MDPEVPVTTDVTPAVPADSAPAPDSDPSAEPAAKAGEVADSAPAPVEEPEEKVERSKAVSELIAQRRKRQEAERQAEYWRGVAEGRVKPQEPQALPAAPAEPKTPVAPKLDQFETYEQYEAAKDKYLVEQAKYDIRQEYLVEQQRQAAVTVEQQFSQRIEAAVKEDPALLDVMRDPTLPVSATMVPILKESEAAPQLLMWLNQNREKAAQIARMAPLQAARELGIVEAQIKFAPKAPPPKVVSAAPEPVTPVVPSSVDTVEEADLPMEEYFRRRAPKVFGKR